MRIPFTLLLICLNFSLFSQIHHDIHSASKTDSTCALYSDYYSKEVIKLIEKSNSDSVNTLFIKWRESCGLCEPLQRAIIIYHLKNRTFNDSILGDSIACNIIKYLDRRHNYYLNNEKHFYYTPIGKEFDKYTESIAEELITKYKKKSVEYLLCELYSNKSDSILIKIKNPRYSNSKISINPCNRIYMTDISKEMKWNCALMSGTWIPTGGITSLGVHPELGFQFGFMKQSYSAQLTLMIKFLKTPNKYYAKRIHSNDSIESTNQFVGPYFGLDLGKIIFVSKKSEVQLLAGLGFDAFTALDTVEGSGRYEDIRSYNINLGIGYRYYYKKHSYIGIESKYNIVDYSMTGVTNLKGNFISIRFILGHID